jgi:hypothetical protein
VLRAKKSKYNSILISADSNKELGDTFMRFQEHYESPNPDFRKQIFTRDQYLNWYSKQFGGVYSDDWSGYNFPSYVLKPFIEGLFDPLTDGERELLSICNLTSLKLPSDKFYIIGGNDDLVIKHELSHALYYTNTDYAREINLTLDQYRDKIHKISQHLLDRGYCEEVIYDEIQAYITESCPNYIIEYSPNGLVNDIMSVYDKYALDSSLEIE